MKIFILFVLFFFSSVTNACPECDFRYYSGVDFGLTSNQFLNVLTPSFEQNLLAGSRSSGVSKIDHKGNSANIYAGIKLGSFVAFESGLFIHQSLCKGNISREGQTRVSGFHSGFVFIFPLTDNLDLVPGVGASYLFLRSHKPKIFDIKENGLLPRIFFGAQFRLTDELKLRCSFALHSLGGASRNIVAMSDITSGSLGLHYSFNVK